MLFSLHGGYQDHSVAVEMVSGADCRDVLSDGDLLDHADQVLAPRVHDQSVVEAELRVSDPHPADVTLGACPPVQKFDNRDHGWHSRWADQPFPQLTSAAASFFFLQI